MGINLTCPQCGETMALDLETTRVYCKHCGYTPLEHGSNLQETAAQVKARGPRPVIKITHRGAIDPRARSIFYTGHDHLFEGDKEAALRSFRRALEIQPDFVDAHLWLAEVADDPKLKREHLGTVLALDPTHQEALRRLMVLDGRLTPEQAARTYHHNDPPIQHATDPVGTETTALLCPNCKGHLTVDDTTGRVECRFCGYTAERAPTTHPDEELLAMALLERRAEPVKWVVAERLLHCNECGAERTIPARKLSMRCPFCGSNHVIEQDALRSFEQPHGLVPFRVSHEEASEAIKARLGSLTERLKGLFDNNKVVQATLDGLYLPFWVFDSVVQVTQIIRNQGSSDISILSTPPLTRNTFTETMHHVAICAVQSPPPTLTRQLGRYDLRQMVAYAPRLLAKYPAELYSMDFDQAALEARSLISKAMRAKYSQRTTFSDDNVEIDVFTDFSHMTFQLVLMPVWVATLVEANGDLRIALVNGQTGKVVLGKSHKRGA